VERLSKTQNMKNLEKDLHDSKTIRSKVRNNDYARKLYAALCNMQWRHGDNKPDELWSCTWRYSGGIVSDLRNLELSTIEDYLDWYCSGNEGFVYEEIKQDLASLGWSPVEWPERH
jgi:hypothetical protein